MLAHEQAPIVVTVDQPPIGRDAALWSAALAERLHCPLRIVHIVQATDHRWADIAHHPDAGPPYTSAVGVVDDAIAVVHRRFPDLDVSGALIEEVTSTPIDPSTTRALATAGQGARMVVLGTLTPETPTSWQQPRGPPTSPNTPRARSPSGGGNRDSFPTSGPWSSESTPTPTAPKPP